MVTQTDSMTSLPSKKPVQYYLGVLILSALVLIPLGFVGSAMLRSAVTVGTTPQYVSCLPWFWFIEIPTPPKHLAVGDLVIARTPKAFHGYRLGKFVIGVPGDHVVENHTGLWINGHYWGGLWLRGWLETYKHQPQPKLPLHYVIPKHHYLLLGTSPMSLDGRYWGLVTRKNILGTIVAPL